MSLVLALSQYLKFRPLWSPSSAPSHSHFFQPCPIYPLTHMYTPSELIPKYFPLCPPIQPGPQVALFPVLLDLCSLLRTLLWPTSAQTHSLPPPTLASTSPTPFTAPDASAPLAPPQGDPPSQFSQDLGCLRTWDFQG